jgi:flagellar export protein FliJ
VKRFRFPLQSVRTLRTWREREAREAFAAAVQALSRAEEALRAGQRRMAETEKVIREGRSSAFRPLEQAAFLTSYDRDQVAVRQAEQGRVEAQTAMDRARAAWQHARNELRVVEELETRARMTHRLAEDRAEQSLLDEIASIRATRPSPALS